MAFRTATTLFDHYKSAKVTARQIKSTLENLRALMVVSNTPANLVIQMMQNIRTALSAWQAAAAQPGIIAEAREQEQDPLYDVATEFVAMRDALMALRDATFNSFPKDVNGWWLYINHDLNGTPTLREFTPAQMASTVALIDAFLLTVD